MKVKEIKFDFSHAGRKFNASGQVIEIPGHLNYPMYRIAVTRKKDYPDIYIFYKVDWEYKPFFWYELSGMQNQMAKSIAKELVNL